MRAIGSGRGRGLGVLLAAVLGACTGTDNEAPTGPTVDPAALPYERLSEYGFFVGDLVDLEPAEGVLPYTVAAPLFSDDAAKGRFLWLPEGETITRTDQDEWTLPTGAIVIKTFFFDTDRSAAGSQSRIVETRLLENTGEEWRSHIYLWNEGETEAEYVRAGADVTIDLRLEDGSASQQLYLVPDENACGSCHERDDVLRLLGVTTHQMNVAVERDGMMVDQMQWLADQGVFDEALPDPSTLPAFPDPFGSADLNARARAYLHGNCSHCHRPGGGGGASGLNFLEWADDPAHTGECKVPAAAGPGAGGHPVDIMPGYPERSIVVFRMASTDPEIKMPELPSLLSDRAGVELITEWIAAMPPDDCGVPE
jgi:uncharacterized repeat protein (TIGR03806 family)